MMEVLVINEKEKKLMLDFAEWCCNNFAERCNNKTWNFGEFCENGNINDYITLTDTELIHKFLKETVKCPV